MMKRLLTILSAALTAGAVSAAAPQQLIDIRTDDVSIVLAARPDGEVHFRHFGSRIDDPSPLADYKSSRRADHGTDDLACPAMGGRNFREPALRITHADGDMNTDLRYVSHSSRQLADPNVTETVVKMTDCCQALDVELVFTAYARENVITTHTVIRNREEGPVTLHSFYSSAVTLKSDKYLLTHLYGAWAREAQVDHTLLTHGSKSIESMREVRTTHTENPAFMLTLGSGSFSENCGEVIAGALAWSGNFRLNFEVDEYDVLTVLAGANPNGSEYRLRPGESFTTPEMIYTHSLRGAGGASRNLHDWGRNYGVYHAERVVPTLLNSWEGAYFDFDAKVLKQMIDDAASMGLEMFVLDDGWFGNKYPRNAANAGLGDWQVNRKKLPAGIDDIASYAHRKGLKFGIWIEPEMVNLKSELAERHPDWIVRPPKREAPETRKQWLLDLSNPAVQDFVFETFDNTMKLSDKIDYIKWDANRNANNVGSAYLPADEQSHFWIDYAQGFYKVMERIRAKYPDVLIQACASGGGRVEYGALQVFRRVLDQRQHRSVVEGPHPVRHEPLLSGRGDGFARLGRAQPPDRQRHADQVPLRHGLRRTPRHGAPAQADDRRRKGVRAPRHRQLQGVPRHRDARRPLPHRHALRRERMLRRAVRRQGQAAGRAVRLQPALPGAFADPEIPPRRTRPQDGIHRAGAERR